MWIKAKSRFKIFAKPSGISKSEKQAASVGVWVWELAAFIDKLDRNPKCDARLSHSRFKIMYLCLRPCLCFHLWSVSASSEAP